MRFPESARLHFERNPLVEVICQVRFPRLPEIDISPAEKLLTFLSPKFPRHEIIQRPHLVVTPGQTTIQTRKEYTAFSQDGKAQVSFTSEALSYHVSRYECWEDFRSVWRDVYSALTTIYPIPKLTRVGLRYFDVIVRSDLGLSGTPWQDLLAPHVAPIALSDAEAGWVGFEAFWVRDLGNQERANLRSSTVSDAETGEEALLIDGDIYTEQPLSADAGSLMARLDVFNIEAGNMFRSCLKRPLIEALRPRSIHDVSRH